MFAISRQERAQLEAVGLLKHRRTGAFRQDANFTVTNREHCGRDKTTYVAEEPEICLFLGKYDLLANPLQRLSPTQFKILTEKGYFNDKNIQHWGQYVPNAIAFEDSFGNWRCKKVTKIMIELGIWSNNKSRKAAQAQASAQD